MAVHKLSQLVLEWIWARPKPLHYSIHHRSSCTDGTVVRRHQVLLVSLRLTAFTGLDTLPKLLCTLGHCWHDSTLPYDVDAADKSNSGFL
jgi:hypothetical protein